MKYRVVVASTVLALLALGRTAAVAQNLLTNPGFDGDLSGWTVIDGVEFDPDLDDTGTPGSGSARLSSGVTGTDMLVLSQCLPVTAGASYTFGVKIFHETPTPAGVELFFFSAIDCTATVLGVEGPLHAALTPGAWSPVDSAPIVAPPGALGMLIVGVRTHFNPDAQGTTNWDDFYVLEDGGEPVPGSITVVKETHGGDGTFAFTSDLPDNASFSITTSGGSGQHGPITVTAPGAYSIAETVPDGWTSTSTTCDNGDDPAQVTIERQESVTCTFVNQAVEVVPALPWVGAIALMLLLATSATWALRRAPKMMCVAGWMILALGGSALCGAQEGVLAQAYGSGLQILPISPYAFTPRHNAPAPAHLSCDFQQGNYCVNVENGSDPVLYAPLDLPAGALIESLVCYVEDTDPSLELGAGLLARTHSLGVSPIASIETSGTPGTTVLTQTGIAHTVFFNDNDQLRMYQLFLHLPADPDLGFWGCAIFWRRQVSPAPFTATFADVPTSHPFFASVEALAASGVTSGCDGGNFCPNQPLTRGQMAVFLAKALGLHWPW